MLTELIDEAIRAWKHGDGSNNALEKAYRNLEKVGVDRITARVMMKARMEELEKEEKA